jgi:hypothetical protein
MSRGRGGRAGRLSLLTMRGARFSTCNDRSVNGCDWHIRTENKVLTAHLNPGPPHPHDPNSRLHGPANNLIRPGPRTLESQQPHSRRKRTRVDANSTVRKRLGTGARAGRLQPATDLGAPPPQGAAYSSGMADNLSWLILYILSPFSFFYLLYVHRHLCFDLLFRVFRTMPTSISPHF